MKRKAIYIVIAVIVLGAAGAAGASAYTGRAVTTRLSDQTAVFDNLLPGLKLEEKVEHGLFRSTRSIKLEVGCAPVRAADGKSVDKTPPIEVHWRDTIHHVPFLSARGGGAASIDSEFEITGAGVEQAFGRRAPLSVHTDVGFDGRFESDAKLLPFKLAPKPGDALEFAGLAMHLAGKFPEGAGTFAYTGHTDPTSLRASAEDGELRAALGRMDLSGSAVVDPANATFLMPYRNETRISELSLQFTAPARDGAAPTSVAFALQGVVGTAESKLAEDLWSTTHRARGSVKADGFAIEKFEMGSSIRNIHAPTFAKLVKSLVSQSFSCEPAQSPDRPLGELEALAEVALELLPYDPEYEVGPIAIEIDGKRAELSYLVGVHGVARGVAPPPFMELMLEHAHARAEAKLHLGLIDDLAAWGEKISAAADRAPDKPVPSQPGQPNAAAMMARAMVDSFVKQGYLEREADVIRGRFEVDGGKFKLNRKPFELPDLGPFGAPDLNVVKGLIAGDEAEVDPDEGDLSPEP